MPVSSSRFYLFVALVILILLAFVPMIAISLVGFRKSEKAITSLECENDNDCPFIEDRTCVILFCNTTARRCEEKTAPGMECSLDEQCVVSYDSPFYACDTRPSECNCYQLPQCEVSENCPQAEDICVSTYCVNNTCIERTTDGVECSTDSFCRNTRGQFLGV